ncbi:MAG: hypothetical protein R2710_19750 [Acidimicrobiales bacterium]
MPDSLTRSTPPSGLLGLIGVDLDPLSGREHILMANLIARAWDAGNDLDLPRCSQLLDPPIRKLGVLDLDTFFPAADRQALVMRLNGLRASPSFASWAEGAPVDIERMLWDADGSACAVIIFCSAISRETERQFAITLILSKLISWMRTQGHQRAPGHGLPRRGQGLAPPVGNPPTKKPILTLLKQARSSGWAWCRRPVTPSTSTTRPSAMPAPG